MSLVSRQIVSNRWREIDGNNVEAAISIKIAGGAKNATQLQKSLFGIALAATNLMRTNPITGPIAGATFARNPSCRAYQTLFTKPASATTLLKSPTTRKRSRFCVDERSTYCANRKFATGVAMRNKNPTARTRSASERTVPAAMNSEYDSFFARRSEM